MKLGLKSNGGIGKKLQVREYRLIKMHHMHLWNHQQEKNIGEKGQLRKQIWKILLILELMR